MQITSPVAVLIILCVTFVLFARLIPWDRAFRTWSEPPPVAPSPEPSAVDAPARSAAEGLDTKPPSVAGLGNTAADGLDRMDETFNELWELIDRIDAVYVDSHTRKWSRIPPSHIELFDEAYTHRPEPTLE